MIIGIFLLIVGAIWLLSNLGVISSSVSNFFWPAILIAVGLQLLFSWKRDKNCCQSDQDKSEK